MEAVVARWGTWEELVLGGAVLRHGAGGWDAVAAELQARTPFPHLFSPEVCQAKFREIQDRYSGFDVDWFEELRKQRVAELKRELEKSEHSIGSLQSKLESLSSGRSSEDNFESGSSRVEPAGTTESTGNMDSSSRDLSKDRSSAGSFTEDPKCDQIIISSVSVNSEEKTHGGGLQNWGWSCRKKRGKRWGRSFLTAKATGKDSGSVDGSTAVYVEREASSKARLQGCSPCCEEAGASMKSESTTNMMDLAKVLSSLLENRDFSMFQHQLNSQRKKARYRKTIRQHVDFDTISAKISNGCISSAKELLRDLLLLANNALVFCPRNSLEHESALAVRELAGKALLGQDSCPCPAASLGNYGGDSSSLPAGKPKKARTMQPSDRSAINAELSAGAGPLAGVDAAVGRLAGRGGSAVKKKRGVGRPPKGGQRRGRTQQEEGSNKRRKRARR